MEAASDDLREDLYRIFNATPEDPVPTEEPDSNALRNTIIAALLLFFLLGSKKRESQLTSADLKRIEEQRDLFLASLQTIVDRLSRAASDAQAGRIARVDAAATIERLISQATALYWIGFVEYAEDNDEYKWVLGDTEHCSTCLGQSNVVRTGAEWKRLAEEQNIYPRSSALECTGLFCQCELVEV